MGILYTASATANVTSAKNCLIQVAGANAAGKANFSVLRVWIKAYALTSAQGQEVEFWLIPIADIGTSMTSNTPNAVDQVNPPTIESTVKTWASGQTDPTGETILAYDSYDQRAGAGYLWLPTPKEQWRIPNNAAFGVVFPSGITATTELTFGITFEED